MKPVRTRRRVLESLAKTKALLAVKADNRIQHHALSEAVLHQIQATWTALIRQVGDAHGLKPEGIHELHDLVEQLADRQLPSFEARKLQELSDDPESWVSVFKAHIAKVGCPDEVADPLDSNQIPLTDTTGLEQLKNQRYGVWVDALSDLITDFQNQFDES